MMNWTHFIEARYKEEVLLNDELMEELALVVEERDEARALARKYYQIANVVSSSTWTEIHNITTKLEGDKIMTDYVVIHEKPR